MVIEVKGSRFSKKYLLSVSKGMAVRQCADKPREVVEEAWNKAHGVKPELEQAETTTKKTSRKK